jgi:hypothetical protein
MIVQHIQDDAHRRVMVLRRIFECCPKSPYWAPLKLRDVVDEMMAQLATGRPVRILSLDKDNYRMQVSKN